MYGKKILKIVDKWVQLCYVGTVLVENVIVLDYGCVVF